MLPEARGRHLHELKKAHTPAATMSTNGETESRGAFPLAVSGVYHDESAPRTQRALLATFDWRCFQLHGLLLEIRNGCPARSNSAEALDGEGMIEDGDERIADRRIVGRTVGAQLASANTTSRSAANASVTSCRTLSTA